jgi:hypothetical protein
MRAIALLVPVLLACGQGADAPADEPVVPAGPAALAEADVAGTWTGVAMPMDSDSIIQRWTQVCASGTCRGTIEGAPDTLVSTYSLDADSAFGTSAPFVDPTMPGVQVVDAWVLRLTGTGLAGTGRILSATNRDSVLMAYRFTGNRAP